jgi:hypothetical protein
MAAADLITLARAKTDIAAITDSSQDATLSTLITAASRYIEHYCRRDFVSNSYDELYDGNGDRRLVLRQYPIISVQSVRYRPVTALKIINNLANTPQSRVSVTSTGLTLVRVTSGVTTTDTSVTWAGNATVVAVQNAVNALGNGWSAAGQGYDQWPSADLYCPMGLTGGSGGPNATTQGALTAAGQYAELKLHTYELAGYQLDVRRGWLLRAIPYTDPELLHPEDLIWPVGINNFRVQYTAGYATVPEDVQEACAELVAALWYRTQRDPALINQLTAGGVSTSYRDLTGSVPGFPPDNVKTLLAPYRRFSVTGGQS